MRIRRLFTVEGKSPYEGIGFQHRHERNPESGRVGGFPS